MTRHARNCTAGAVYTYNEKKKDTRQSGYGSQTMRVGKDSVKEFDCCCLTLQPCRYPVVTPDGYLYDKEAILEYIIHQKRLFAKQMKAFEKQKTKAKEESHRLEKAERKSQVAKSLNKPDAVETGATAKSAAQPGTSTNKGISNMREGKNTELPSFWIPMLTPQAKETQLKKPDEKVRCPMSGKPIKLKDLIEVKFREIKDGDKRSLITKDARYVCAVTNDVLSNSVPCAVLKTSGEVVTMECFEKLIKKDMLDPINGKTLKDSDIIQLQRGSSGFSGGAGSELVAKKEGPSMMA